MAKLAPITPSQKETHPCPSREIKYDVADKIATITLNRPEKLNAFTGTMMNELIEAFGKAMRTTMCARSIVTGAGRAFCAGADLSAGRQDVRLRRARRPAGSRGRGARRERQLERRAHSRRRRARDVAHLRMLEARDRGGERCRRSASASRCSCRWTSASPARRRASASCSRGAASCRRRARAGSCRASSASRRRWNGARRGACSTRRKRSTPGSCRAW